MTPTFKARTRAIDVCTLIGVAVLSVLIFLAWQNLERTLATQTQSIQAMESRLTALESKGASTVIFNLPEVKGSPYWNIDQKGFDLAIPEVSSSPEKTQKPSGGSRKGG